MSLLGEIASGGDLPRRAYARRETVEYIAERISLPELIDLGALLREDHPDRCMMIGPHEQLWASVWTQRRLVEKGLAGFWDERRCSIGPTRFGLEVYNLCRRRWRERQARAR